MANAFSIYLNENIKVRLIVQQYKMPENSFEKAFFYDTNWKNDQDISHDSQCGIYSTDQTQPNTRVNRN